MSPADLTRVVPVTAADYAAAADHLAWLYGPSWPAVVTVIDTVRSADSDTFNRLDAAWDAAWVAAWDAAWDAARDAAWDAAWDAARDALVHDLVGQHGYTAKHEALLIEPYAAVFGLPWGTTDE